MTKKIKIKLTKVRYITPNFLIVVGLVILLATILICHVQEVRRLNNELQTLRIGLNQANTNLSQATAASSQEREKIIAARELRNFSSLDELEMFLARDNTDGHEYIKNVFDCDDFALMLQEHALEEGYLVNCQILFTQHMMNMAIVGNELYYIEPRTDNVTYAGYIDP